MDSFDDLLAPSRRALESNPFEDPFGKRSGSPDPWASPFASQHNDPEHNAFADHDAHQPFEAQPFGGDEYQPFGSRQDNDTSYTQPSQDDDDTQTSPKPTLKPEVNEDDEDSRPLRSPTSPAATTTSARREEHHKHDPLDSLNVSKSEDPLPDQRGPIRSPGFLQDIPSTYSEVETIRPPVEEETKIALPSQNVARSISESSRTGLAGSPTSPTFPAARNPLTPPTLESSIRGLSIGGETFGSGGGWNTSRDANEDDSDDDTPIGQTAAARLAQQRAKSPPATPRKPDPNDDAVFVISVDDPQKVGDPMRSFTLYTVHTRTTSTAFQKSAFSVLRRYSDFLWLYETLAYNNPGVVIPPIPEKNSFGRFDDQFVKQRRTALEKCVQKIANHSVLNKDPDFRLFLESDTFSLDIKHRGGPRGGFMSSIGQSIAGPRFHETDDWFDRQKSYLDHVESQLRTLVKAIDFVSKQREELAESTREHIQMLNELASSDIDKGLATSISSLADVHNKAQELMETQSQQDLITFFATADEYARMINSVRMAFTSRIRVYHAWRAAEAEVVRVKQNHEKNRNQGRIPPDRMGYALNQVAETERRALETKHEFDHVSKLVKSEMGRFEQERVDDFKDSLHAFLEGMISRQKELIETWERYQQTLLKRAGVIKPDAGQNGGDHAEERRSQSTDDED